METKQTTTTVFVNFLSCHALAPELVQLPKMGALSSPTNVNGRKEA